MRPAFCLALVVVTTFVPLVAEPGGRLVLEMLPAAKLSFGGPVGERIERNIDHWLLVTPAANPGILEMFRARDRKPEPRIVPWAGEFAGKYLISAVQALRMTERPDLERHVARFVDDLIATQAADGYLGPFPERDRLLGNWDLWGHYHVMQGLLLWHERTGDERALRAAVRAADLICKIYLDGWRRVYDAGSHEMNMAVIHVLGWLHRLTSNERYLRLMREIERDWERAGDYFRTGLAGVEFYRTPRPRWESLHDLQGLVELYRITGDERYRAAFVNLWRSIARRDRHNTGGFSSGEQAVGHPYSPAPIETCCTIAWMAITVDMLRLTGEPAAADELELSTFNGMLGAQHPSGRWWTYDTPMDGVREASAHTIVFQSRAGTPELNCCSVNAPRGLGMLSEWSLMSDRDGLVLSYYGPMKAAAALAGGLKVTLEEDTGYPAAPGPIRITVSPERPAAFTLKLRIPAWSRETRVTIPGGVVERPAAGTYLALRRQWQPGDRVGLDLDQRLRLWAGDREAAGKASFFAGPLLLAYDQRFNSFDEEAIPRLDAGALAGTAVAPLPAPAGLLAPWLLLPVKGANGQDLVLCDFASAGTTGTRYRSWLPVANAPPPPVILEQPRDGAVLPPGKARFAWGWRRKSPGIDFYRIVIAEDGDFSRPAVDEVVERTRLVIPGGLPPGREHRWKVVARNASGSTESETRSFRVDASLPPLPEPAVAAFEPRADGALLAAPLRGGPEPAHGALQDAAGVAPTRGPSGQAGAALSFDGEKGRARYSIPYFPERDFTVAVRIAVRAFPEKRIGQVFSAWAAGMDDPLRLTVDGGRLFARIEAGSAHSTEGIPLEPGRWTHVAAVKAGARLTLHVDGKERASARVPEEVYSAAANVALGGNPNFGGNEFLAADMADFVLYDRALGVEELQRLAR